MSNMQPHSTANILHRIRIRIWIVVAGLFLSGVTAFPLESELKWLADISAGHGPVFFHVWFVRVYQAVSDVNFRYPYLSYGTDWLAFAHVMLAILFAGIVKDPVKNNWVIKFGIIAAIAIFPLAFIAGSIRQIPLCWQLVDCSFGVVTLLLLMPCMRMIKKLNNPGHSSKSHAF